MQEKCAIHGTYESREVEIFGMKMKLMCPECEKLLEVEERDAMERARQAMQEREYRRMGIEPEFYGKTLDNYFPENKTEQEALDACRDLIAGRIDKLLLIGCSTPDNKTGNGVGKTHLASAVCKALGGYYITMSDLGYRIRESYTAQISERSILEGLNDNSVLVIDEVGKTKGSDAERNWLSYIIDKMHVRGRKIVLATNCQLSRNLAPDRQKEALEFYLGNDSISRLKERSRIVEIKGRDRRI